MEKPLLKGQRTYIALFVLAVINLVRISGFNISPEIESAVTTLLIAFAAYFRAKA